MGQVVLRVLEVVGLRDSGLTADDPKADKSLKLVNRCKVLAPDAILDLNP